MARLSGLSPRTVDYYTSIGLIQPTRRSQSNYRLYNDETLKQLQRIEQLKKDKYTLDEIRDKLAQWNSVATEETVSQKLSDLSLHMAQLQKQVNELEPVIQRLKPRQARRIMNKLMPQTAACVEALLLLLGKGPLM